VGTFDDSQVELPTHQKVEMIGHFTLFVERLTQSQFSHTAMYQELSEHTICVLAEVGVKHSGAIRVEILLDVAGGMQLLICRLVKQINRFFHPVAYRLDLAHEIAHFLLARLLMGHRH